MNALAEITIIIATYNRAHLIEETLASIKKQTYNNWECLIIDDGSIDNTNVIIKRIIQHDKRFEYFKRSDKYKKGLSGCRNLGIDNAAGNYILFVDDDDILNPNLIQYCIDIFKRFDVEFVNFQKKSFKKNIPEFEKSSLSICEYISVNDINDVIMHKIPIASCTVMWNKKCFSDIRFNENLMYAEEWECYSKIISNNFKGIRINNILYHNRKHENSNTGEYYKGNKIRITSKKLAIKLIAENLAEKKLLDNTILKYLIGLTIGFGDKKLLNELVDISSLNIKEKIFFNFKNIVFPLWKIYKKL